MVLDFLDTFALSILCVITIFKIKFNDVRLESVQCLNLLIYYRLIKKKTISAAIAELFKLFFKIKIIESWKIMLTKMFTL